MYDGKLEPTVLMAGDMIMWDSHTKALKFFRTHGINRTIERLMQSRTDNKILAPYIRDKADFQNIAILIGRACHCDIKQADFEGMAWLLVDTVTTA